MSNNISTKPVENDVAYPILEPKSSENNQNLNQHIIQVEEHDYYVCYLSNEYHLKIRDLSRNRGPDYHPSQFPLDEIIQKFCCIELTRDLTRLRKENPTECKNFERQLNQKNYNIFPSKHMLASLHKVQQENLSKKAIQ